MSSKIKSLPYWPVGEGYVGIINGEYYELSEPDEFLAVANRKWPHTLFRLDLYRDGATASWLSETDD